MSLTDDRTIEACACRVITWEPVPHFRAFLEYNRQLNHLEDLIEIRDTAVSDAGGGVHDLTVPNRGIWGTAGFDGLNIDKSAARASLAELCRRHL